MSTIANAPCRCRTCDRTATRNTPAAETSADPTLCPRCEHYRVYELAGLAGDYQGADSAVFVDPVAPLARRCQCCDRTAMFGTPAAATAVDRDNCPRCDHFYAVALAGGPLDFRGVDSPVFVAAQAEEPARFVLLVPTVAYAAEVSL